LDAGRNVTVDRGPDDNVAVPYDGVDTLNKATETNPGHIQTSASVPSLQMPIERDGTEKKAKKGKGSVKMVAHYAD